jgi:hypothetical protein
MRVLRGMYEDTPPGRQQLGRCRRWLPIGTEPNSWTNLISASCEIAGLNEHLPPRAGTLFPHWLLKLSRSPAYQT